MKRLLAGGAGSVPAPAFLPVQDLSSDTPALPGKVRPERVASPVTRRSRWICRALVLLLAVLAALAAAAAAEVKLAWDPSPDASVTGYRVYWGYQSRTYAGSFDVGNVTTATVGSLGEGTTYYFAVTACAGTDLESDYSNEVEYTTPLPLPPPPPSPVLESVAARKVHNKVGAFDVPLALHGGLTVEGRLGTSLALVFRFDKPLVAASAAVTRGQATVAANSVIAGQDVTVSLVSVADAQWLTVTLVGIEAEDGGVLEEVSASLGLLGGDVDGDGVVTTRDVDLVRAVSGRKADAANFRADVDLSGALTGSDVYAVRLRAGKVLPAW